MALMAAGHIPYMYFSADVGCRYSTRIPPAQQAGNTKITEIIQFYLELWVVIILTWRF